MSLINGVVLRAPSFCDVDLLGNLKLPHSTLSQNATNVIFIYSAVRYDLNMPVKLIGFFPSLDALIYVCTIIFLH